MRRQAENYGVEILEAVAVNAISADGEWVTVTTAVGDSYNARAVLVATGSSIGAPAPTVRPTLSARVFTSVPRATARSTGAKEVLVIGGGNSGSRRGLFLTQFADHVTVAEYSEKLAGSRLLQDKGARTSEDDRCHKLQGV